MNGPDWLRFWRNDNPPRFPASNPSAPVRSIDDPQQTPIGWVAMRRGAQLVAVKPGTVEIDAMHRQGGWIQIPLPTQRIPVV